MNECLLSIKQRYQQIMLEQYKDVVFVAPEEFVELHRHYNIDHWPVVEQVVKQHMNDADDLPFVCYVLGAGVASAGKEWCCNGLRYGEDGDYISFMPLPSSVWVPF